MKLSRVVGTFNTGPVYGSQFKNDPEHAAKVRRANGIKGTQTKLSTKAAKEKPFLSLTPKA